MKLKYRDVYTLYDSLKRMGEVSQFETAYAIAMTMGSVRTLGEFIEHQRERIIRKYGKTEDGLHFSFPDDKIGALNKEMAELLEKETEVDITQVEATMEDFRAEGMRAIDYEVAMKYLVKEKGEQVNG